MFCMNSLYFHFFVFWNQAVLFQLFMYQIVRLIREVGSVTFGFSNFYTFQNILSLFEIFVPQTTILSSSKPCSFRNLLQLCSSFFFCYFQPLATILLLFIFLIVFCYFWLPFSCFSLYLTFCTFYFSLTLYCFQLMFCHFQIFASLLLLLATSFVSLSSSLALLILAFSQLFTTHSFCLRFARFTFQLDFYLFYLLGSIQLLSCAVGVLLHSASFSFNGSGSVTLSARLFPSFFIYLFAFFVICSKPRR